SAFDRTEVTLFYSLLAGTLVVAPWAIADWAWPADALVWLLLLSMGLYGGLGHYAYILAHPYAPASTIPPLPYISLTTHSTPTPPASPAPPPGRPTAGLPPAPGSSPPPASPSCAASAPPPAPPRSP